MTKGDSPQVVKDVATYGGYLVAVVSAAALCGRRLPRADVNLHFSSRQRTCGGVSGTDARSQLPFLAEATVALWRAKLRRDFPAGAELTSNAHGSSLGCNARSGAVPRAGPRAVPRDPNPRPPRAGVLARAPARR